METCPKCGKDIGKKINRDSVCPICFWNLGYKGAMFSRDGGLCCGNCCTTFREDQYLELMSELESRKRPQPITRILTVDRLSEGWTPYKKPYSIRGVIDFDESKWDKDILNDERIPKLKNEEYAITITPYYRLGSNGVEERIDDAVRIYRRQRPRGWNLERVD